MRRTEADVFQAVFILRITFLEEGKVRNADPLRGGRCIERDLRRRNVRWVVGYVVGYYLCSQAGAV